MRAISQLSAHGAIERPVSMQRVIVVTGLLTRMAVEELRAAGWNVNGALRQAGSA